MIMKMGDNASRPEDEQTTNKNYDNDHDNDDVRKVLARTITRQKVRSIAMRTEFQLGIERPKRPTQTRRTNGPKHL